LPCGSTFLPFILNHEIKSLFRVIAIGLTKGIALRNAMPGGFRHDWWGYHGDDGDIQHHNPWEQYPPFEQYGKGDVVGCGVDQHGTIFFTKNGKRHGE
jgi:hypothetical protein